MLFQNLSFILFCSLVFALYWRVPKARLWVLAVANALFYMASRGIPEADAKALLTRAFVADAIDRIGEEEVKAHFYADAEDWFGGDRKD